MPILGGQFLERIALGEQEAVRCNNCGSTSVAGRFNDRCKSCGRPLAAADPREVEREVHSQLYGGPHNRVRRVEGDGSD
jgi:tRNA(Ile2) C34 agmatinyltransferase TiaS